MTEHVSSDVFPRFDLDVLPVEILDEIFSYVDILTLKNLQLVSQRFNASAKLAWRHHIPLSHRIHDVANNEIINWKAEWQRHYDSLLPYPLRWSRYVVLMLSPTINAVLIKEEYDKWVEEETSFMHGERDGLIKLQDTLSEGNNVIDNIFRAISTNSAMSIRFENLDCKRLPPFMKYLSTLNELKLSNLHSLERIDCEQFSSHLYSLRIEHCMIRSMNVSKLPRSLKILRISRSPLDHFDFSALPKSLMEFELIANTSIRGSLSLPELPNLSALRIVMQPMQLNLISFGANLRNIQLVGSHLPEFDTSLLPPFVQTLDLSHSRISRIDLQTLPSSLRMLNLTDNNLINPSLHSLPASLECLELGQNLIYDLNLSLLPQALLKLDLSGNSLRSVYLADLPQSLQQLNLSENRLKQVSLDELPENLKVLDLAKNKLQSVDLRHLPRNLQWLSIAHNEILAVRANTTTFRRINRVDSFVYGDVPFVFKMEGNLITERELAIQFASENQAYWRKMRRNTMVPMLAILICYFYGIYQKGLQAYQK